jgi:hypothetical protein
MDWIELALETDSWRALVDGQMLTNIQSMTAKYFITYYYLLLVHLQQISAFNSPSSGRYIDIFY